MNILDKIVNKKRERYHKIWDSFNEKTFKIIDRKKPIDIFSTINERFFIISECKKGSPSKGVIVPDYNPIKIAEGYISNNTSAISVITEEDFFFGSIDDLKNIRKITDTPLLRKDFIIHPFQVYEAYNAGADIVLLIVAILNDQELSLLYNLINKLEMSALIEVHTVEEIKRIFPLKPKLLGINNRNLKTFEVDIDNSIQLKKSIPKSISVISESGISTAENIQLLKNNDFTGALIGEAFLRAETGKNIQNKILNDQK